MDNKDTIEAARAALLKSFDSNSEYSYDDFLSEYGHNAISPTGSVGDYKIPVDFVNKSTNQDPDWETSGSAGFDLRASEYGSIEPNEIKVVPTGLFFNIPENFEIQIRPRSGLAAKHGITVLNSPGTIDSDYTGEVKVILINLGSTRFDIATGDRIAQAVISTVTAKNIISLKKVDSITKETDRGDGGFGSTGLR